MFDAVTSFDFAVLDWIRENLSCGFLDGLCVVISGIWHMGLPCILLAAVLLLFRRTRKTGTCLALAILFGFVFGNLILKNAVARIRPYDLKEGIDLLVNRLKDYSFPSGHTLVSFETATVIFVREKKRYGIPAFVAAAAVAFSRLYLYVHYPTDVVAGIVLGVLFGLAGCCIGGMAYDLAAEKITGEKRN